VPHDGLVYCDCDHCVRLALRRLTAARDGEETLRQNQRDFIAAKVSFFEQLRCLYEPFFDGYDGRVVEMINHHADPHPKKKLREQAFSEIQDANSAEERIYIKKVKYKMKPDDIARFGKYGRMIGDLGVAASLQGFRITEMLKLAQSSTPVDVGTGEMVFVKSANSDVLRNQFQHLSTRSDGKFHFTYHSDDSVYRTRDGIAYNIDIASCDASHTNELFDALLLVVPDIWKDDLRILCDQCRLPIEITSRNGKQRVLLRPIGARLYSGSTLTTFINNIASMLIALAISEGEQTETGFVTSAARAGYLITLQRCDKPEDIQFLKRSPVFDASGELQPVINMGVFLRASGTCRGDLAGRGDVCERAREFQRGLIQSTFPRMDAPFLKNLLAATKTRDFPAVLGRLDSQSFRNRRVVLAQVERNLSYTLNIESSLTPVLKFSDRSLFVRYDLSEYELEEMLDLFSKAGFRDSVHCSAVEKILQKDYGLGLLIRC